MQEQLVVILTTTLSLLTAWAWNSVLQQYLDEYYGKSLTVRFLFAIIITVVTFALINWLLRHFTMYEEDINKARRSDIKEYVRKKIRKELTN